MVEFRLEKSVTIVYDHYRPLSGECGASETSFIINLVVLLMSIGITAFSYVMGVTAYVFLVVIMMGSQLVLTVVLETVFSPVTCALSRLKIRRRLSWRRVLLREVALLVTFGVIAVAYWMIPAFSDLAMEKVYYPFLWTIVPSIVALSVPYFCLMDRLDVEEEDVYCHVGRAIITGQKTMSRFELANYIRSWIIKAFWLSVMQPPVVEKLRVLITYHWELIGDSPMSIFIMASTICYALDLFFAASGYVLNLKMFNTHTRTAEPTLLGWVVTVGCYWPFWGVLFYPYFFKYQAANQWNTCFVVGSMMWWIWASAIIMMEALYASATISAGIRFSNLTYRGLWNTGPYRWTKHPAYVFKNISWWLIYVPFLANSGILAIKCSLLLVGVNFVYYLRARTEERHLSHYPEYVAYAMWMNRHGIFRWCAMLMPFLRYEHSGSGTLTDFQVKVVENEERRFLMKNVLGQYDNGKAVI